MKKSLRRALLVSLLATVVYQGALATKRFETMLVLDNLRSAGYPVNAKQLAGAPYLSKNAGPYYTAAAQMASELPQARQRLVDRNFRQANAALIDSMLTGGADALNLLQRAGQLPQCSLTSGDDGQGIDYLGFKHLIQLACLEMDARAKHNDVAGAVAQGQQAALLIQRVAEGKALISHQISLVYAEQLALSVTELREDYPALNFAPLSASVRQLADKLDADLLPTVREERALGLDCFDEQESGHDLVADGAPWAYCLSSYRVATDRLEYLRILQTLDEAIASGSTEVATLTKLCSVDAEAYPLSETLTHVLPSAIATHRTVVDKLRAL